MTSNPTQPLDTAIDELLINLDAYKLNSGGIMGGVDFSVAEHYAMSPELKKAKAAILALITRETTAAELRGRIAGKREESDRRFAEYQKVQDFYKTYTLDNLIFPDHCSSCHAEWGDNFAEAEDYCCSKAPSNIRNSVMKWHQRETKEMYDTIARLQATINVDGQKT